MRNSQEFAEICRDYALIVGEIAHKKCTLEPGSEVLADLRELKSGLENDIVEMLNQSKGASHS